jgi:tetratricopeptide (TPR) repeat protein
MIKNIKRNIEIFVTFLMLIIVADSCIKNNSNIFTKQDSIKISNDYIDSGNVSKQNKNYKQSEEFYQKAYLYNNKSYSPIFFLANLYLYEKKYLVVIGFCDYIEKWYAQDDDFFMVFDIKAQAFQKLKRNDDALKYFNKEIELILSRNVEGKMDNSLLSWIYSDRARILYNLDRNEESLSSIEESLNLDKNNMEAIFCKGLIYLKAGRKLEACDCFDLSSKLGQKEAKKYFLDTCLNVK